MILGTRSANIFNKIIKQLGDKEHITIDNTDGAFMPLHVEKIGKDEYSIAHYGKQNGDLMADPEMTFVVKNGFVCPLSYRNDYLGIDTNRVDLSFCNVWFRNIKEQQKL